MAIAGDIEKEPNMTIPEEFTSAHVEANSGEDAFTPYLDFLRSKQPYASILMNNPSMMPPRAGDELVWGEGKYYDTTVARKHEERQKPPDSHQGHQPVAHRPLQVGIRAYRRGPFGRATQDGQGPRG
jgi:hypothetical protein